MNGLEMRVAFVINHAAFFVSHRLPLAVGARQVGFDVGLFFGQPGNQSMEKSAVLELESQGFAINRTMSRSAGMNPLLELIALCQLILYLLRYKPDIVHCASPKGVLYGGIAARVCRTPALVLAITGMGYAYTQGSQNNLTRQLVRSIYSRMVNWAYKHPNLHVIVQNQDDLRSVLSQGLAKNEQVSLIPGSGVDLDPYKGCDLDQKKQIVMLPARMLKDKGVLEFVAAAGLIKPNLPGWRFILVGAAGYDNPSAISENELNALQANGHVEWHGHVENMTPLYKDAAIVCLPSYREGMPKSLLEAAAAACAVVTTDVIGCRESIVDGETGILVPSHDAIALANALKRLIQDQTLRMRYGIRGRERAFRIFSIESVVHNTVNIYKGLIHA